MKRCNSNEKNVTLTKKCNSYKKKCNSNEKNVTLTKKKCNSFEKIMKPFFKVGEIRSGGNEVVHKKKLRHMAVGNIFSWLFKNTRFYLGGKFIFSSNMI